MHSAVERLEAALEQARRLGLHIRCEPLEGAPGGVCEFGGRKWLFVDLTLTAAEQLDQVLAALAQEGISLEPGVRPRPRQIRRRAA